MVVTVTTAIELSEKYQTQIKTAILKKHPKATLDFVVDQAIIGGIIVRFGSKELDASLRGKLNQISNQISTAL